MTLLRSVVVLVTLLAQAWPAQAMRREETAGKCEMACCAWLTEAGVNACDCAGSSLPEAPADLPPAGTRQIVTQVVWAGSQETLPFSRPSLILSEHDTLMSECDVLQQPHVRLPVLFCSLLN